MWEQRADTLASDKPVMVRAHTEHFLRAWHHAGTVSFHPHTSPRQEEGNLFDGSSFYK